MKVTYDFNLPEDQNNLDIYSNSMKYYLALWDFQQQLHALLKYDERDAIPVEEITSKFNEVLNKNEVYTLDR